MLDLTSSAWPMEPCLSAKDSEAPSLSSRMNEFCSQDQFVKEGTAIALPMQFPHVAQPIPRGECAVTALAVAPNHVVYGGTSGERAHLFCAMLHAATGFVHDLGVVENATAATAVGLGVDGAVYACVNSATSGWIVRTSQAIVPHDSIQEWVLAREPIEHVITPQENARILTAQFSPDGAAIYLLMSNGELHAFDVISNACISVAEVDPHGRGGAAMALDRQGRLYGTSFLGRIWQYDPHEAKLVRWEQPIACGAGRASYNRAAGWAADPRRDVLYVSSAADGTLSVIHPETRQVRSLGQIGGLQPAAAMAVTIDGRLFGITHDEEAAGRLFVYDPAAPQFKDLGICVSVLGARVYGFTFRCATLWRDGAIVFGEADDVSHLWVYFPAIRPG